MEGYRVSERDDRNLFSQLVQKLQHLRFLRAKHTLTESLNGFQGDRAFAAVLKREQIFVRSDRANHRLFRNRKDLASVAGSSQLRESGWVHQEFRFKCAPCIVEIEIDYHTTDIEQDECRSNHGWSPLHVL